MRRPGSALLTTCSGEWLSSQNQVLRRVFLITSFLVQRIGILILKTYLAAPFRLLLGTGPIGLHQVQIDD